MARTGETPAKLGRILKEELKTMPLSRVTVSHLTARAGITRQAFYYHFNDVNDLASWVFMKDVGEYAASHATQDGWAFGLREMLRYMYAHKGETYAVLTSLDADERERFFYRAVFSMMLTIVREVSQDMEATDEEREYVAKHISVTILGHVGHWFATDMAEHPDELVHNLHTVLHGRARLALMSLIEDRQTQGRLRNLSVR